MRGGAGGVDPVPFPARRAAAERRSHSSVTSETPSREELLDIIRAASRVADHGALRPWRLIEIRGDARKKLGRSFAKAEHKRGVSDKPMRAELLIALVASRKKSSKEVWEQDATAAGVAHMLSLLLDEAGWGVFWRSGDYTRAKAVRRAHDLAKGEELLGWLYVGGKKSRGSHPKRPIDPEAFLTSM